MALVKSSRYDRSEMPPHQRKYTTGDVLFALKTFVVDYPSFQSLSIGQEEEYSNFRWAKDADGAWNLYSYTDSTPDFREQL